MDKDENLGDVEIKELSDSRIEVTVEGVTTEVGVERIYRIDDHFGEFRSLQHVVAVLRARARDE